MRKTRISLIYTIFFLIALFGIISQSTTAKEQEIKGVEGKDYIIYKSPTDIDFVITPSISYDPATGLYKYEYKLYSKPASKQDIWIFYVETQVPCEEVKPPSGWRGNYSDEIYPLRVYPIVDWHSISKPFLRPNQTLEGFSYRSKGIPGIATSYTVGWVESKERFPEGMAPKLIRPKGAKPWVTRKTIGPVPLPDEPVDTVSFAFRMESLTRQAGKLGWIKSETLTKSWAEMLDGIKDYYPDKGRVKDTLNALITELESQRGKQIDDNAYYLLKLNAEYLQRKM